MHLSVEWRPCYESKIGERLKRNKLKTLLKFNFAPSIKELCDCGSSDTTHEVLAGLVENANNCFI
jgi:hypothetical protein